MCGIVGFLSPGNKNEFEPTLKKMAQSIQHRGPDGAGFFCKELGNNLIAIGHRRLSILELSEAGAQPMLSSTERYVISFNGEIYNHLQLRKELNYKNFRGGSDTETLLAAIEEWGLEKTLSKAAGMFAIALWDQQEQKLFLARDRMGEKPLYYGKSGASFFFTSELKSLKHHPHFSPRIQDKALQLFLQFSYIPSPFTIYENFHKLPPAHYLVIDKNGNFADPICYWNLQTVAESGLANPMLNTICLEEMEKILAQVLQEQIVADVPVGSFLSGGIDSSLITALLTKYHGNEKIRTFSIGFSQPGFDESAAAKAVAKHLGTLHTELFVQASDALKIIPSLNEIYDEPFADVSQLPSILLSKLARQHVTVGLSGDGGDEVFAGYNRYLFAPSIWEKTKWLPQNIKSAAAGVLNKPSADLWEKILPFPQPGEKIKKLDRALQARSPMELYWSMASQGLAGTNAYLSDPGMPFLPAMQFLDQKMYLPDDILVKVDRAAMFASLETRAPFLDHRVVEAAWKIPLDKRTSHNKGKIVLREILSQYVPEKLWNRPKAGFTPPIDAWLRGSLKEWAEDLLSEKALSASGLPEKEKILSLWKAHRSGNSHNGLRLWPALVAQAWLKRSL